MTHSVIDVRQYVEVFAQMSGVGMASLVSLWDTLNKTCNNFFKLYMAIMITRLFLVQAE